MKESRWKLHRSDFLAVLIAMAMGAGWYSYNNASKRDAPATDWFSVRNISVPDFVEGEDPIIIYDRDIKKSFNATWSVEVHGATASTNYPICTGSGNNKYQPGETLPEQGVRLSWFVGRIECVHVPPGKYNLEINYEIRPPGYPTKIYTATSNIFTVAPKGSELYLSPDKIDQLDKAQDLLNNPILEQLQMEPPQ